ncbi:MAG TPA: hypothetical protein VIV35_07430 [Chitinophagaceae bacterium]
MPKGHQQEDPGIKKRNSCVKKSSKSGGFTLGPNSFFTASCNTISNRSGREAKVIHKPVTVTVSSIQQTS